MSATRGNATIVGVGVAACALCCAGPILGILTAIGLGTAAGIALLGTAALLVGAIAVALVLARRRRRRTACVPGITEPVPVELSSTRARS